MATEAFRGPHFQSMYANQFLFEIADNELTLSVGMKRTQGMGPTGPVYAFEAFGEIVLTWRAAKLMRDELSKVIAKYEASHPTILTPGGDPMERQ